MSPLPACHNAASFGSRQSSTLLLVWFCESRSLTTMRDELQWLRIGERIKFKLSILVYKCLNNSAPPYLADKTRPLSNDCNRSRPRSSNSADVFVPRTKTKMGDRAFEVAGPRTWNSLPATIRETKTLPAFKKQLKLYLIGNPEY